MNPSSILESETSSRSRKFGTEDYDEISNNLSKNRSWNMETFLSTLHIGDVSFILGYVYTDAVSNRKGFMTWKPHRKRHGFKEFTRNLSNR